MDIQIDHIYTTAQLDALFDQLLAEKDFVEAYEANRDSWCSQTREELLLGRKVAVGAWTVPDKYSGRREDLAGACILKRSDSLLGPELELEVIHVARRFRTHHHYYDSLRRNWVPPRQIGCELLQKAEQLCQKYGYNRIVTRVPVRFPDLVFFLLRYEFVIHEYDVSKEQYHLAKALTPTYIADPYDVKLVVDWLCAKWGITIHEWLTPDHAVGTLLVGGEAKWEIGLDVLVCQDSRDLKQKIKQAATPMCLVVFRRKEDDLPAIVFKERKVHIIQPDVLKEETGNHDLDLTLQDIAAGVLVPIRKEFFERFEPGERRVFLDGGEYGQVLVRRVQAGTRRHTFIVFSNSDVSNQEILGVGRIVSVHNGTPEALWEQFGSISTFGEKSDFDHYTNIKTRMTAIVFEQLEANAEPADFGKKLSKGGWCYLSDEEFYQQVLAGGGYPQTRRLTRS